MDKQENKIRYSLLTLCILTLFTGLASPDITTRVDKDSITALDAWNRDATERLWGCDKCAMGDIACSLGSAIAAKYGKECGYDYEKADYYGYNDMDEITSLANPRYWRYDNVWDNKKDYESGIPDFSVVKNSVESIETKIDAYFIKESRWKFPPYWMNIYDPNPWDENLNWEVWVMPCAEETEVEWSCKWYGCQKRTLAAGTCLCEPCPGCTYTNLITSAPTITCTESMCYLGTCPCPGVCFDGMTCDDPTWSDTITCDQSQCKYLTWKDRPISECEGLSSGSLGSNEGQYTGWRCYAANRATGQAVPNSCGPKGAGIEVYDTQNATFYYFDKVNEDTGEIEYYGYPHSRGEDGEDLNDDLGIYNMITGTYDYYGNQPYRLWDIDLVRDRYWKMNYTNLTEDMTYFFKGTRPGYCAYEGEGGCIEGGTRDDFDRPSSKQHDPCAECTGYDKIYDTLACINECFNYDLRYYRQFNIDSVWVNVFKITPEINYMLTDEEIIPDTVPQCLDTRPGDPECEKKNIHEICSSRDDCIEGLDCIKADGGGSSRCCMMTDINIGGCCRDKKSMRCNDRQITCPTEDITEYKAGIGEVGCSSDNDCAEYLEPGKTTKDPQHCSQGVR